MGFFDFLFGKSSPYSCEEINICYDYIASVYTLQAIYKITNDTESLAMINTYERDNIFNNSYNIFVE